MSEEFTEVKISMPLIDDIELKRIDNFYNDIVDEYTKAYVKEKEQVIIQRLMKNLREENQHLQQELTKYKERNEKVSKIIRECLLLFPHEFDWSEQMEHALKILENKEKEDD